MKKFVIEASARHVHLCDEAIKKLFGEGYTPKIKKYLSQPGQYVCEEKVKIVGPRGELTASILGPNRPICQVELSATDARSIGIAGVIKESGRVTGSPGCTIVGPNGKLELEHGVIVAKRHIHMTPADAERFGVHNKQIVSVRALSENRSLIFEDVVVRVHDSFALAMHIDTDENNAALGACEGQIV